jgi:hypothetical protein
LGDISLMIYTQSPCAEHAMGTVAAKSPAVP